MPDNINPRAKPPLRSLEQYLLRFLGQSHRQSLEAHPLRFLAALAALLFLLPTSESAQASEEISRGKILIANEALNDPNFDSTVILIVGHGNLGTLGLIINRPLKYDPLQADLWKDDSGSPLPPRYRSVFSNDSIYFGGPVKVAGPRALAASRFTIPGAIHIQRELYFVDNQPAFEYLLEENTRTIRFTRVYFGISSWIPGQLQAEVRAGAWYVQDSTEEMVFSDNESLWEELITKIHGKWVDGSGEKNSLPDVLHPTYNAAGIKRVADNKMISAINNRNRN